MGIWQILLFDALKLKNGVQVNFDNSFLLGILFYAIREQFEALEFEKYIKDF